MWYEDKSNKGIKKLLSITFVVLILLLTEPVWGKYATLDFLNAIENSGQTEDEDLEKQEASSDISEKDAEPVVEPVMEPVDTREWTRAKYIGALGHVTSYVLNPNSKIYQFEIDGRKNLYKIDCGAICEEGVAVAKDYSNVLSAEEGGYRIHNLLMKNYEYDVVIEGDSITDIKLVPLQPLNVQLAVNGEPGKKTIKNFIATAMMPVGKCLYVFGGGWDFQNIGTANSARTIGYSDRWEEFYESSTATYRYMNYAHPQAVGGLETAWNEFNYAGLDCSGFVGWTLYNTLYDESMVNPGMVDSSTKMASKLANEFKLGEFVHPQQYGFEYAKRLQIAADEYSVGDVVSLQGHVFIVLGKCDDGSLVIVHSTPEYAWDNASYGYFGGGVMLSPLNPNNPLDKNCEAYRLVKKYMTTYYPEWTKRYPVIMKNSFYFSFPANTTTGVFHWNLFEENGLSDPDGYRNMTAEEILQDLFRENEITERINTIR